MQLSRWTLTLPITCAVVLATTTQLHADPVPLTGGAIGFAELGPGGFTFRTATFEIGGDLWVGPAGFGPFDDCFIGICVPGSSFDVDTDLAGYIGHGPAAIDGTSYSDLHYFGSIHMTGPSGTVPDVGEAGHTVGFFPFSLTASLAAYAERSEAGTRLLSTDVVGSGMARIVFRPGTEPGTIRTSDTSYQISSSAPAPVPEPATLLLVGTGGALAMARRRRSSSLAARHLHRLSVIARRSPSRR